MDIHMDIHIWISIYGYPQGYPCATFRYLLVSLSRCAVDIYMDILRDIHVQDLDIYIGIWHIYMPSIIPQSLATDPSHGRAKIAAI